MDTQGQFGRFWVCVAAGVVGGVIYELCSFFVFGKKRLRFCLRTVADILFFALFAVACIIVASVLKFPSFREYYYFGYALGFILYLKTFHKAVAFFKKTCYNGVKKLVNCVKNKQIFRKKGEKRL